MKIKRRRFKPKGGRPRSRKYCRLCADKVKKVDYKDTGLLRRYVTERGKVIPSRISGNCASHQRMITRAVKRARFMALLPFMGE